MMNMVLKQQILSDTKIKQEEKSELMNIGDTGMYKEMVFSKA